MFFEIWFPFSNLSEYGQAHAFFDRCVLLPSKVDAVQGSVRAAFTHCLHSHRSALPQKGGPLNGR